MSVLRTRPCGSSGRFWPLRLSRTRPSRTFCQKLAFPVYSCPAALGSQSPPCTLTPGDPTHIGGSLSHSGSRRGCAAWRSREQRARQRLTAILIPPAKDTGGRHLHVSAGCSLDRAWAHSRLQPFFFVSLLVTPSTTSTTRQQVLQLVFLCHRGSDGQWAHTLRRTVWWLQRRLRTKLQGGPTLGVSSGASSCKNPVPPSPSDQIRPPQVRSGHRPTFVKNPVPTV